ncbi:MAG TPA: YbaK/EbsC family protein [Pseudonocardia sp.]|nr:YbaK/EbsC family protein [Pseudonocardia sp.]
MPPPPDHPNVQAVVAALRAGGAAASGARMRVLPDAVTTARAAADALGIEVGQIANSLIFVLERSAGPGEKPGTERSASGTSINTERSASGTSINTEPLLVLASGAHRVDTAKLAAQLGAVAIRRADQKFVRAATGQVIGGVAPVGHPARLRTVVDTALAEYAELWCGGGIPHAVFPTSFDELITLTGGTAAAVAEGS